MPDDLPPGIEALPNGQWIVADDTHFAQWSRAHGNIITDPGVFRFLHPFIKDCKVVWDIGACIGDHTRWYLDQGFQVVAFEPHPVSFACLSHNCPEAINLNIAASSEDGSLPFMSLDNVGASRVHPQGEWSVPARALDDMPELPVPDYVKIDAEGFEPRILMGMTGILTKHRPILFIEANRGALEANGYSLDAMQECIMKLGYSKVQMYPAKAKWMDPQFDLLFL